MAGGDCLLLQHERRVPAQHEGLHGGRGRQWPVAVPDRRLLTVQVGGRAAGAPGGTARLARHHLQAGCACATFVHHLPPLALVFTCPHLLFSSTVLLPLVMTFHHQGAPLLSCRAQDFPVWEPQDSSIFIVFSCHLCPRCRVMDASHCPQSTGT